MKDKYLEKLLETVRQIQNVEDFVKLSCADGKINQLEAREICRMLSHAVETAID